MFRLKDFLDGVIGISISHTGEYASFINYLYQNELTNNANLQVEELGVKTMAGQDRLKVYYMPRKRETGKQYQPKKYDEIISMSDISDQLVKNKVGATASLKTLIAHDKAQYAFGGTQKFVFIPTVDGTETKAICINLDTKENVELDDSLVTTEGVELDKLYTVSAKALLRIMAGKKISAESMTEEDFHLVWERSDLDKFALEIAKLEAELVEKKTTYNAMLADKKANK